MTSHVKTGLARALRGTRDALLDLVYPRECLITGEIVPPAHPYRYLSATAVGDFRFIHPPHCRRCGFPFFGLVLGARDCPHCRELQPLFSEGRSLLVLKGPVRQLVYTLKYHAGRHIMADLGRLMGANSHFIRFLKDARLVPVPLHPRKQRERGFNQSLLIAREMAAAADGARVADILTRLRDTPSQTRMDRSLREKNVKNAFALKRGGVIDGKVRYVLVDDVFTTGATLNACAAVLRRAGAARVDVATFGHG